MSWLLAVLGLAAVYTVGLGIAMALDSLEHRRLHGGRCLCREPHGGQGTR